MSESESQEDIPEENLKNNEKEKTSDIQQDVRDWIAKMKQKRGITILENPRSKEISEKEKVIRSREELENEKQKLENEKQKLENEKQKMLNELKKKISLRAYRFLICWSMAIFLIVILDAYFSCFDVDTIVLAVLAGATSISAMGLFGFIIKGLFMSKE